jgi:hypothetical protein
MLDSDGLSSKQKVKAMPQRIASILFPALLIATVVCAQQGERQRENVRAKGKLKGVRPGLLAVETSEGEQWLVKVDARPQNISFVASADPNWLRPGMLVKFKNTFDAKGKPQATVRQLEVISPRTDTKLGLIAGSSLGSANVFSDEEPKKKKKAPKTKSFTVAGTLRGLKNRKLVVAAGRTLVKSELDEKAKISVDVADYSLGREGDSIELSGWYYLGRKDRVYATRISISSSRMLGEEVPTKGTKKKEKKSSKSDVEKSLEDLFKD